VTFQVFYRRSRLEPLDRVPDNDFIIDDSEDGEEDDMFDISSENVVIPLEEVDLCTILRTFKEEHISDDQISIICIRRRKLLESAIKAISRVTFSWTDLPQIEFVGEDADDMGGPQREFFRLLMIELQTSLGIFEGKAGQVFFTYDQAALEQRKYFKRGNLIAWSIAHGGPCIRALDPSLFQLMCGQEPQLEQFDSHVLPDPDVQSKLKQEKKSLSKAAFKAIFSYNYSTRGSNHREAEEDTIFSWEMVLNMIEDKVTELRFEDLLIFVTGADEVPALGFPRKPRIDFYEQEAGQRRLPYTSTCAMCLYLPRGITEEDKLHEMLFQATRDSLGFGKV
ncbi:hypothetical protein GBF38_016624, partial [Nibea albiflora]